MYLNYFHLTKKPFHITPDPEFIFMSPTHREALATIMYGVGQRKGFIMITGEVGVGKTTILRAYLDKVDRMRLKPIYIFNPNVSFTGLLRAMCQELGLTPKNDDPSEMLHRLHLALIDEYRRGCTVALIIDEVQNMPIETLENLRMLSNLETSTDKLIQIVLSGQPEFRDLLDRHELRQLKQRIAVKVTIAKLSKEECAAYIHHRLAMAGRNDNGIFTRDAIDRIICQTKGIPRMINILCDNALLTAYGYRHQRVESKTAREIIADHDGKKELRPFATWGISAAAIVSLMLMVGFWGGYVSKLMSVSEVEAHPKIIKTKLPDRITPPITSPEAKFPVTLKANRGDNLNKMVEDMYGVSNTKLIRMVKEENPHISDANIILEGEKIRFPKFKE